MLLKTMNFYRKDAKFAKKHNTSPAFLSFLALLASLRWGWILKTKNFYREDAKFAKKDLADLIFSAWFTKDNQWIFSGSAN